MIRLKTKLQLFLKFSNHENVKFFEKYWNCEINPNPGLTVVEIMESIYSKEIKDLYVNRPYDKQKFWFWHSNQKVTIF